MNNMTGCRPHNATKLAVNHWGERITTFSRIFILLANRHNYLEHYFFHHHHCRQFIGKAIEVIHMTCFERHEGKFCSNSTVKLF